MKIWKVQLTDDSWAMAATPMGPNQPEKAMSVLRFNIFRVGD